MTSWIPILLPFGLLLGRVSAFFAVLPIFGGRGLPVRIRAAMALLMTVFFAKVLPYPQGLADLHWLSASILMTREIICGLALGLSCRLLFLAAQQGGQIAGRQMGIMDAGVFDPTSGERTAPIGLLVEMTFTLLFLTAGGHRLLILTIARSYEVFPSAQTPDAAVLAEAVLRAGATMLLFALKLAAPMLAAFVVLSVVLGVLARVLPEMNILLASFPLRVGLGLFMAAQMVPLLGVFTNELAGWMNRFLIA